MKRFAIAAIGAIAAVHATETEEVPVVEQPVDEVVEESVEENAEVEAAAEGGLPEGMDMEALMEQMKGMGMDGEMPEGEDLEDGEEGEEEPQEPLLKNATIAEMPEKIAARARTDAIYVFEGEATAKAAADAADGMGPYAQVYHVTDAAESKLTVYRGIDETKVYESADYDFETIKTWAVAERLPLFGEISGENAQLYFSSGKNGMAWVCLNKETVEEDVKAITPVMQEFAAEQPYPLVFFDVEAFKEHADAIGCTTETNPTIVLERGFAAEAEGEAEEKQESFKRSLKSVEEGKGMSGVTLEALKKFMADIESGELKPEPKPEPPTEAEELENMDEEDDEEVDGEEEEVATEAEEVVAEEGAAAAGAEVPADAEL